MSRDDVYKLKNTMFIWCELNENFELQMQINKLYNDWCNLGERAYQKAIEEPVNFKASEGILGQLESRQLEINTLIWAYNKKISDYPKSFKDLLE